MIFLSFLSQLSSAQLRGISAKFHINIFYSSWPPPTEKTIKKFRVSPFYTLALGSTVNDCYIQNTGCLTTEMSKVEAFYAHLGWNFLVFQTLYSKITLVHLFSNSENGHYVIIGSSADIFSWQFQLIDELILIKENYFKDTGS